MFLTFQRRPQRHLEPTVKIDSITWGFGSYPYAQKHGSRAAVRRRSERRRLIFASDDDGGGFKARSAPSELGERGNQTLMHSR